MRIRLEKYYRGNPSNMKQIVPGDYDEEDLKPGLAQYLVDNRHADVIGHAERLDVPVAVGVAPTSDYDGLNVPQLWEEIAAREVTLAPSRGSGSGGNYKRDDLVAVLVWDDNPVVVARPKSVLVEMEESSEEDEETSSDEDAEEE